MRTLSALQVLGVWEQGEGEDSVERILTLLSAAYPEKTREELAGLNIRRRDVHLLELHQRFFGSALEGYAECPECGTRLEYSLSSERLLADGARPAEEPLFLDADGFSLRLRQPNSLDLIAANRCEKTEQAVLRLVQGCVMEAKRDDSILTVEELPAPVVARISAFLEKSDPQAELLIGLDCPVCAHEWQVVLDIASFLWTEIRALAKRLMRDVALLAQVYGWREADILAMSAIRRQHYLEIAG